MRRVWTPIQSMEDVRATGKPTITTELTSKRLKGQQLLSVVLVIVGVTWAVSSNKPGASVIPGLLMFVGFVWLLATRFRIWWNHK